MKVVLNLLILPLPCLSERKKPRNWYTTYIKWKFRDHLFSMYAKFSEQLTFLTSWYAYSFDSFIVHMLDYMKSVFNENAILVTIFWNFSFSTFHYIFNLPQVKQNLISQENILCMSCFRSYRVTQDKNSHKLNIQRIYQGLS